MRDGQSWGTKQQAGRRGNDSQGGCEGAWEEGRKEQGAGSSSEMQKCKGDKGGGSV